MAPGANRVGPVRQALLRRVLRPVLRPVLPALRWFRGRRPWQRVLMMVFVALAPWVANPEVWDRGPSATTQPAATVPEATVPAATVPAASVPVNELPLIDTFEPVATVPFDPVVPDSVVPDLVPDSENIFEPSEGLAPDDVVSPAPGRAPE